MHGVRSGCFKAVVGSVFRAGVPSGQVIGNFHDHIRGGVCDTADVAEREVADGWVAHIHPHAVRPVRTGGIRRVGAQRELREIAEAVLVIVRQGIDGIEGVHAVLLLETIGHAIGILVLCGIEQGLHGHLHVVLFEGAAIVLGAHHEVVGHVMRGSGIQWLDQRLQVTGAMDGIVEILGSGFRGVIDVIGVISAATGGGGP